MRLTTAAFNQRRGKYTSLGLETLSVENVASWPQLAGAGEVGATSRNRKAQAAAAPPPPVFDRENTSLEKVIAYNYDPKKFFQ